MCLGFVYYQYMDATQTPTTTRRRRSREVETTEYLKAASRFMRAAGRRVADADEVELADLLALQAVLDEAIQTAIDGQRERGLSWAYIAQATGKTRQAAFQRWGKK